MKSFAKLVDKDLEEVIDACLEGLEKLPLFDKKELLVLKGLLDAPMVESVKVVRTCCDYLRKPFTENGLDEESTKVVLEVIKAAAGPNSIKQLAEFIDFWRTERELKLDDDFWAVYGRCLFAGEMKRKQESAMRQMQFTPNGFATQRQPLLVK